MFRDTQKELQRLEAALLSGEEAPIPEEQDLDALLDDTRPADGRVIYQNHSNAYGKNLRNYASGYKAYNSDRTDQNPEIYSRELLTPEKGIRSLIILAVVLTLCIAGVAICWLVRYWGVL